MAMAMANGEWRMARGVLAMRAMRTFLLALLLSPCFGCGRGPCPGWSYFSDDFAGDVSSIVGGGFFSGDHDVFVIRGAGQKNITVENVLTGAVTNATTSFSTSSSSALAKNGPPLLGKNGPGRDQELS